MNKLNKTRLCDVSACRVATFPFSLQDFSTAPHQLSTDGDEQLQFNGVADWLFSGEITDDNALLWWSSESSYLAYAK